MEIQTKKIETEEITITLTDEEVERIIKQRLLMDGHIDKFEDIGHFGYDLGPNHFRGVQIILQKRIQDKPLTKKVEL
jgi:hypothetical protein